MAHIHTPNAGRGRKALIRIVAAGGFALSLAACQTNNEARLDYPQDYRQRHPITLGNGTQTVEVFVGQNRGGMTAAQRADVLSFARAWRNDATSGILIEAPKGPRTDRATADSLREIHSIFAASGIPSSGVTVRTYRSAGVALPSIKLNYSRIVAQAGPCGQWRDDLGVSVDSRPTENREYWNLGCATQRNLASMVDNPADLVQPRGETPAMWSRRSIALDKYRKGESPSGTYPNDGGNGYDNGKISDVGK